MGGEKPLKEVLHMNWDIVEGNWNQMKGEARKAWGKLTDNDLEVVAGQKDKLVGKLQEHYGWARNEAERRVDETFFPGKTGRRDMI